MQVPEIDLLFNLVGLSAISRLKFHNYKSNTSVGRTCVDKFSSLHQVPGPRTVLGLHLLRMYNMIACREV